MIKLVTFPQAFGLRNVSPFCLKVEMLLKSLDLSFEIVEESDPRKSPKGKLPFLITDQGIVADSELITEFLDELTAGKVYEGLDDRQRATGVAYSRLAEDHLYWILVASRWLDDGWWPNVINGFFGELPPVLKTVISRLARRQVRMTYKLHGLGKHSLPEQEGFARRDLAALNSAVGTDGFLLGDRPYVFDFAVASLMAGAYDNQPATWVTRVAEEYPDLKAYTERVQETVGVYARR